MRIDHSSALSRSLEESEGGRLSASRPLEGGRSSASHALEGSDGRRPSASSRSLRSSVGTADRPSRRVSVHRTASRALSAGILALLTAVLVGCSATPAPQASVITLQPEASEPAPSATDLVAARRAAGIPDCPELSPSEPVTGGLPAITLACLGGDTLVPLAALRGPMLINLWAQWCEPCRQEAPHLAALSVARPELAVLGIDYTDPRPELAIEFAQLAGWTYPHLTDPERALAAGGLAVPGIPMTLLLDAEGVIVARHAGEFTTLDDLLAFVDEGS